MCCNMNCVGTLPRCKQNIKYTRGWVYENIITSFVIIIVSILKKSCFDIFTFKTIKVKIYFILRPTFLYIHNADAAEQANCTLLFSNSIDKKNYRVDRKMCDVTDSLANNKMLQTLFKRVLNIWHTFLL